MKLKLFQNKIVPSCSYCLYSKTLHDTSLCERCGIVAPDHHCRKFRYDPLKRTPEKKQSIPKWNPEDFSLDN